MDRRLFAQSLAGAAAFGLLRPALAAGQGTGCAKTVYLTFDTGHMGIADLVADVLKRHAVPVTFFAANEPTQQGDGSLGETWAPGWHAWVDGQEAPVLRANVIHRAVRLPAGQHRVEFRYVPAAFRLGLYGTAAALAVLLALGTARFGRSG